MRVTRVSCNKAEMAGKKKKNKQTVGASGGLAQRDQLAYGASSHAPVGLERTWNHGSVA